jgi:hypothetical protein
MMNKLAVKSFHETKKQSDLNKTSSRSLNKKPTNPKEFILWLQSIGPLPEADFDFIDEAIHF